MIGVGITAVGSGIGLAVLRSLRVGSIPVRIVGMDADPAAVPLRWCDAAARVPRVAHPGYVDDLIAACATHGVEILIPGSEIELPTLAAARERFAGAGIQVIVASPQVVDLCIDKLVGGEFVTAGGLPFVPTWTLSAAQQDADQLRYPVIAKPRRGAGSIGARAIADAAALRAIDPALDLVVQPYAGEPTGPVDTLHQKDEFSLQYAVGDTGTILGRFGSIGSLKAGIPWAGRPVQDGDLLEQGDTTARALIELGLRGPFNLQGRIVHGQATFFEMNARFTGITSMRSSLGFREVEAAIHALAFGDEDRARSCLGPVVDRSMSRYLGEVFVEPVAAAPPMPTPRPRILVTGASGYLGRAIVGRLADEPWVGGVVAGVRTADGAPDGEVAVADLGDEPWDLSDIDLVVHTAAVRPEPGVTIGDEEFYRVNAAGTGHLVRRAAECGVDRFVYLSSQAVYGTTRPPLWTEADPIHPETAYAYSKWFGEVLAGTAGVPTTVILRLARVYGLGDGMGWKGVPHSFAMQAGQEQPLTVHGTGEQRVDLLHLDDAVDAVVAACRDTLPPVTVLNIGSGRPTSIRELVEVCAEQARSLGHDPAIVTVPATSSPVDFGMEIGRAEAQLGWRPQVTLADGLRPLIQAAAR